MPAIAFAFARRKRYRIGHGRRSGRPFPKVIDMSRKFALLLLAPALASTPVQAQEAPSGEQSVSVSQPVQCGTRRPTIFGGRASTQPCVAATSQMRCKASRPTIFGGGSSSEACVPEFAGAQTASYRPTIFGGRRGTRSESAGYQTQAASAGYAGTYAQPGSPQAAYGQDQSATGAAPAQAEQQRTKRRRPTIFGGGRRAKNPE